MKTATGEHWSEEVVRPGNPDWPVVQTLYYLQLAYVTQVREGGPWYCWCMGVRVGSRPTKESAMRCCGEWLAKNWDKVEWSPVQ